MDISKIKQTVYLIFTNDAYREYAKKEGLITPNGLSDDEFIKLSETYGKNYSLEEFEMFWNTGKIPAFCYLRIVGHEEA